jgi:hypothetical protein
MCWAVVQPTVYFLTMGNRNGFSLTCSAQSEKTLSLAEERSSHSVKMWERVPGVGLSLQVGREQKPLESPDQCLDNQQLLKRPESILAWQQAFSTSYGLLPDEVQIGWVLRSCIHPKLRFPEVNNLCFCDPFERRLGWWVGDE